jgi:hypothetical protein
MELSLREIKSYSRINTIDQNFLELTENEQKNYITEKLKDVNWCKSNKRIHYNTWLYYKYNGYNPELINDHNIKYYIILNKIKIKINIRVQDFFFIKFMIKFIKKKNVKNWLCDKYLVDDKVLIEYPIITHKNEKNYRVDYLLNISDDNYVCIEFFENAHKCKDDPDLKKEKNRIYSIIHDSDNRYKRYLFFSIFWEEKLSDENYFTDFVKIIYNKIEEYKDINNERIWCIAGINKFINNKIISENIYDSYEGKNKTVINIDELNKVIGFKDENSIKKHYEQFIKDVNELVNFYNDHNESIIINNLDLDELNLDESDLDDSNDDRLIIKKYLVTDYIDNNKLSLKGMVRYLKINKSYLINIGAEENILTLYTNIISGFVNGLKDQRNTLLNLEDNRIIGIYDYK